MRSILAFIFIVALASLATRASTAVFSKDAKHIFLLRENSATLVEIDIAAKTFRSIDLTGATNDEFHDLAVSNSGFIICTATDAVWSFDPATGKCVKVCASPKGVELRVIACDPVTGAVIVAGAGTPPDQPESAGWPAYCLAKGSNVLERIRTRYGSTFGYPAFAPDGTLYFEMRGDLWCGKIGDTVDGDDGPFRPLLAYRCAPLASLIDENTSPPSTGLEWSGATKHFMYASLGRIGGSGWGDLIRFPRPVSLVEGTGDDANISGGSPGWDQLAKLFSSIKEIDESAAEYLCATPDGRFVFFADPYRSDKISLIENDGKPRQIEIKGLMDLFK